MIYRGKSDHYIQSITRIKRFEIIVIVIEKKKKGEWNGSELGGPDWHENRSNENNRTTNTNFRHVIVLNSWTPQEIRQIYYDLVFTMKYQCSLSLEKSFKMNWL